MPEPHPPAEITPHHEATATSNNWLQKTRIGISKFLGSAALTIGSETFVELGAAVTKLGLSIVAGTVMEPPAVNPALIAKVVQNPNQQLKDIVIATKAVVSGAGLATEGIGTAIGWQGVKHAPSRLEKAMYLGSKAAVLAGMVAGIPTGWQAVLGGISLASTAFGMRHRK